MKNSLLVLIAVLILCNSVFAEDVENAEYVRETQLDLVKESAGFVGGFASGVLFHEFGHEFMAELEGVDLDWDLKRGRWTAQTSGNKLRNIAFGGFGAQIISTEILLGNDKIPKKNSYVLGWLAFNVINEIIYPLRDELQDGGYGDLKTLRKTGVNTNFVNFGLIAHGLWTAYRVYNLKSGNQSPNSWKFAPCLSVVPGKEVFLGFNLRF